MGRAAATGSTAHLSTEERFQFVFDNKLIRYFPLDWIYDLFSQQLLLLIKRFDGPQLTTDAASAGGSSLSIPLLRCDTFGPLPD